MGHRIYTHVYQIQDFPPDIACFTFARLFSTIVLASLPSGNTSGFFGCTTSMTMRTIRKNPWYWVMPNAEVGGKVLVYKLPRIYWELVRVNSVINISNGLRANMKSLPTFFFLCWLDQRTNVECIYTCIYSLWPDAHSPAAEVVWPQCTNQRVSTNWWYSHTCTDSSMTNTILSGRDSPNPDTLWKLVRSIACRPCLFIPKGELLAAKSREQIDNWFFPFMRQGARPDLEHEDVIAGSIDGPHQQITWESGSAINWKSQQLSNRPHGGTDPKQQSNYISGAEPYSMALVRSAFLIR